MSGPPPDAGTHDPAARVRLCGVELDAITERACIEFILSRLDAGRGGWVVTVNLDHLRRLVCDAGYARLCGGATLRVADGMPLIWASRVRGTPLPERVAGSQLIATLSAAAARRGRSIYLLGGDAGTAEAAAAVLQVRSPALRVAGTECPAVGFEHDDAVVAALAERLRVARPDIVYVALGSPKQERVIARLRDALPGAWWIGVGISFSFLAGRVRRAPPWMQRMGLEWVHRLSQEPGRLARRYLVAGLPFAVRLMVRSACERVVSAPPALVDRRGAGT
ncbi:MAG: WecB/TagA/CpsF family glycosyltransferase [Phycisphaeraceae bacterium]